MAKRLTSSEAKAAKFELWYIVLEKMTKEARGKKTSFICFLPTKLGRHTVDMVVDFKELRFSHSAAYPF